jgi:DNA-binding NtrC family response regulator
MVSLSESPDSHDVLRGLLSSCAKPTVPISQVFQPGARLEESQAVAEAIIRIEPELVFILISPPHFTQARQIIDLLSAAKPDYGIVAFIEDGTSEAVFDLVKAGADDVFFPPFTEDNVLGRISQILRKERSEEFLLKTLNSKLGLRKMVGTTHAFLAAVNKIPLIARCDANVLIAGETGTGKEIYARSIHYLGRRAAKPFVAASCGAIPSDLFENEFFGHERGAFTGALTAQTGLIQEAEGGTLFLDDVDCIPPGAQMKMLRFLQEKEFRPLGSSRAQHSDTRIVASTNRDMAAGPLQDVFRRDLFYRLSVITVTLPPLRDRLEDIPVLARHFIEKYSGKLDGEPRDISPGALQKLMGYAWPGNVRELENIIERAVVFSTRPLIDADAIGLPEDMAGTPGELPFNEAKQQAVAQFERRYIRRLLITHRGNISESARAARKNRRAFWELIRKHKIDAREYKSSAL